MSLHAKLALKFYQALDRRIALNPWCRWKGHNYVVPVWYMDAYECSRWLCDSIIRGIDIARAVEAIEDGVRTIGQTEAA